MVRRQIVLIALCAVAWMLVGQAWAQQLVIGLAREPRSVDPHYQDMASNNALARHIFDALVRVDGQQRLQPGLATSWRPLGPLTWEFTLRQGVTFHDGSPFSADDVVFTVQRVPRVPHSPAPFSRYTRRISAMEAPTPYTVIIRTSEPHPLLPGDLSMVSIMSRRAAEGKSTAQMNTGEGIIGTGPYRFVSRTRGKQLVLARNQDYWAGAQPWEQVVLKPIASESLRLKALGKGSLSLIEQVSPKAAAALKKDRKTVVFRGVANRIIYLHVDSSRSISPFVGRVEGNPFQKTAARQAVSLAIDRKHLADKVLDGMAIPSGQLVAKGGFGYVPELQPDRHDPRRAIRLLGRAGFRRGFDLTVHGPNNRFLNDGAVVRAIVAMLGRVGIRAKAETMPKNVYFPRAAKGEFSLMLSGWRIPRGDPTEALEAILSKFRPNQDAGRANLGRYANDKLDQLLAKSRRTVDPAAREELLRKAITIGLREYGIIPLYFEKNAWAARKPLKVLPRADGLTLAMSVRAR